MCPFTFPPLKAGDTYQAVDLYFTDKITGEPLAFPVGSVGRAQIREIRNDVLVTAWTVTVDGNKVTLEELTPAQTQGLKAGLHAAEVEVTTPDGRRTTWIDGGRIEIRADRTHG